MASKGGFTLTILLYILKIHLISVYFFIKLFFRQRKQVCFLSRQTNEVSLNYRFVMEALDKEDIPYAYVCKKVDTKINDSLRTQGNYSDGKKFLESLFSNLKGAFSYYFSLYRQMRLIASSKVVITDGYNLPVSLLKHKKGTKVIQMWHALGAVKKFGYQVVGNKEGVSSKVAQILKMHHNYDYILSGSEAMNPYFSEAFHTPESKILAIGTPTVDYLRKKDVQKEKAIYKRYPILKQKVNVLYSPTFRNDKRSGLAKLIKAFDFDHYNLVLTFHPKVKENLLDDRIIRINSKEFSTYDVIKLVDYVITDYSALLMDALVVDKKLLFYVYDYDTYEKDNGLNLPLLKEYPHLTKKDAKELMKIIKTNSYDEKEYARLKEKYAPKVKNSTDQIIHLIKECLKDA